MSYYPHPWPCQAHADYDGEVSRLMDLTFRGMASVGDELRLAYLMNNPPPPEYITCGACNAGDVPYEKAWPDENFGLICEACKKHFDAVSRKAKEDAVAKAAEEQDLRRKLGGFVRSLLADPNREDSKKIRKEIKTIRKTFGWKPCQWCSICTRPLVKDNSTKDAKVCNLCDPDGEKGKPKEKKPSEPVHADRYVVDLKRIGFAGI